MKKLFSIFSNASNKIERFFRRAKFTLGDGFAISPEYFEVQMFFGYKQNVLDCCKLQKM